MILRTRGYLTHIEIKNATYFVTFRLADSLPDTVLRSFDEERANIIHNASVHKRKLSQFELRRLDYLYLMKVERFLDSGAGHCWLSNAEIAKTVAGALKFYSDTRYTLHTWCIMPNHVHVLFTPMNLEQTGGEKSLLIPILHSWKSFTAQKSNRVLKRTGKFWQEEYFDTLVRSERQFAFYIRYILLNPVKAGLCNRWRDWSWSGCSKEINELIQESLEL
jgi:REP element-mobilizing transposase RayT